jgi:two-component system LytT family response regulator
MPVVVFVTAYDQHACALLGACAGLSAEILFRRTLRGGAGAPKAHSAKKVSEVSRRLMALLGSQKSEDHAETPTPIENSAYLMRLVIKSGGRVFFLKTSEIDWIEAADYYVYLHVNGKSHLLRETMNNLEKQLDSKKFQRIHRSTIVNLDRVKELQPHAHGDYTVILQNGVQLKLSRSYRPKLEAALGRSI